MKFSNTIKTVLKIHQKYVKNSVWFGTGGVKGAPLVFILRIYNLGTLAAAATGDLTELFLVNSSQLSGLKKC